MEQNNKNKEQTSFKIFDKVLVRNSDEHKWRPAIFARTRIGEPHTNTTLCYYAPGT